MENKWLVSVIIPTYNQNELFRRAVKSVLSQSYKNLEIIIVDDNVNYKLKEDNKNFVAEQKDDRIKYFSNEKNLGSAKSRNRGIFLSGGDYITFLDDDDYYDELKIEKQLRYMAENNFDVTLGDLILFNENGKEIDRRERNYFESGEPILNIHLKYHLTGTDTMMFKSDFIKKINGFDNNDLGDEFYLMLKAIERGAMVGHVSNCISYATVHNNTGLSGYINKIKTEKEIFNLKKRYFNSLSSSDVRFIKMRHHAVNAVAYKKGKKFFRCFISVLKSFFYSPSGFIRLYKGENR